MGQANQNKNAKSFSSNRLDNVGDHLGQAAAEMVGQASL